MTSKQIIQILLCFSLTFGQSKQITAQTYPDKKSLYKQYLLQTLPAYLFFAPYSFMYGVTLGGSAISEGASPFEANSLWLSSPLIAGLLVHLATKDIIENVLTKPKREDYSSTFYYNIYYAGPDISSIENVNFEGIYSDWEAHIDEVPSGFDYPSLGFRTGFMSNRYGLDFEMALIAHHTLRESIIYEYTSPETGIIPIQQSIPSHFYMLHSMLIGLNTYFVLPKFSFLKPYIGVGGGILLNSVQSEYPGPADLVRADGKLALDEMGLNFGGQIFFGFRFMKESSFYYIEVRPTLHKFELESGSTDENASVDKFNLKSAQFQFGIGRDIFK